MATNRNQATNFDPYAAHAKKSPTATIIGSLIFVLVAGFALGQQGLIPGFGRQTVGAGTPPIDMKSGSRSADSGLQVGAKQGGSHLEVGAGPQGSVYQVGAKPTTPSYQAGADRAPALNVADKMPADVRDWLRHLEKTENQRMSLTKGQLGQLVGQLAGAIGGGGYGDLTDPFPEDSGKQSNQNYDPGKRNKLEGDTKGIRQSWKDLDTFFNSKQPPAECVPIKNAYEQCLGETGSMVLDVQKQLANSHDDPQGAIDSLMNMMGTSQGKIDVAAGQSDQLVYDICRKYDTFKWFKISSDIGGGLMGGLGGVLGGLGG